MQNIISALDFDKKIIEKIFKLADGLKKNKNYPLKSKIMATLFFEPSTRTRFSFESAMLRLGGSVISAENAREVSSAIKGETIEDTAKIVSAYADVIVMRHFEEGALERSSKTSRVPLINAGDGRGEHPTQALLDIYTIKKELGKIDGLNIAMVGDLKNGRTVRSLSEILANYKNIKIYFVSPKALKIGDDIKKYLNSRKVFFKEVEDLGSIIGIVDVLYQTRIQRERFNSEKEYKKYKGCYKIDNSIVSKMKNKSIIMHPLPRIDEILPEVDSSKKAVYFKQAENGLYIRMALLFYLLG